MRQKVISLLMCLVCMFCKINNGIAYNDFYADCIKNYELTESIIDGLVLYPLNYICRERCDKECKGFSRRKQQKVELNEDVIENCMTACQKGEQFSSIIKESTGNQADEYQYVLPAATGTFCSLKPEDKKQNATRVRKFTVRDGDKIMIYLAQGSESGNMIFMCGKKNVTLRPTFPNVLNKSDGYGINADWDKNNQTEWKDVKDNPCLQEILAKKSKSVLSYLSSEDLWSGLPPGLKPECYWHARNTAFTKTGIYLSKGDSFSIKWYGNYFYEPDSSIYSLSSGGKLEDLPSDRREIAKIMRNPCDKKPLSDVEKLTFCSIKENITKTVFDISSNIAIRLDSNVSSLQGEDFRSAEIGVMPVLNPNSATVAPTIKTGPFYGLSGATRDIESKISMIDDDTRCPKDQIDTVKKKECSYIEKYGMSEYAVYGMINVIDQKTELELKHFLPGGSDITKLKGGYTVDIKWSGCPFFKGELIQYALLPVSNDPSNDRYDDIPTGLKWSDIDPKILEGEEFEIKAGSSNKNDPHRLFLRIKPLPSPATASNVIKELYEDPANRHGSYFVTVKQLNVNKKSKEGPFEPIIKIVVETMLGKDRIPGKVLDKGAVYNIYSGVIKNSQFINLIRVSILLYISLSAVGFVIGIIQIDREQLIKRLIKISFVLAVISDTSWEFFGGYLVPTFVDGTAEIISLIMGLASELDGSGLTADDLKSNPYQFVRAFNIPYEIIKSTTSWKRILAIFLHDGFGFITVLIILLGIVQYLIIILKSIVVYLISILAMSFLLIMTPIMLPMLLFGWTKSIFDNWIKNLISFSLQPIMLFTSITLFNLVHTMLLQILLGFTICPDCWLMMDLSPLYKECWIPFWIPVLSKHLPPGVEPAFGYMTGSLLTAILLLLIVDSNNKFITFITNLAARIVTGVSSSPIAGVSQSLDSMEKKAKDFAVESTTKAAVIAVRAAATKGASLKADMKKVAKDTGQQLLTKGLQKFSDGPLNKR